MSWKRVGAITSAVGAGLLAVASGTMFLIVLAAKVTILFAGSPIPALALVSYGANTAFLAWTARALWHASKTRAAS
jgi:hypothetical protein